MFSELLQLADGRDNRYVTPVSPEKGDRTFGGQFLAQCVSAGYATVETGRDINSLHAYFLRPGDVDLPTDLEVDPVRDGRAFSSRQIIARQKGKELFRMMASFQTTANTPHYVGVGMPDVPPPEAVSFSYDDFNEHVTGEATWPGSVRPMDIRYINAPLERGQPVTEPQLMWLKINETLNDDPGLHRAGIAYLSDSALADHVMLPHGLRWQDSDFAGASLDHSMWFHDHARADDWLLFAQGVEATGHGRGLSRGHFFTREGNLVATCVQECLMRWRPS